MLIKGAMYQEGIMIVNIYTPNVGALSFLRQTLVDIKEQINPHNSNSR
jgi:hypothetical protein